MIKKNPDSEDDIDKFQKPLENIPKEIKDELGSLRAQLVKALNGFKTNAVKDNLKKITDYNDLTEKADRRDKINEIAKDLVNFIQGIKAIRQEHEGERKDLDYLRSQEKNLEQVAMSKALPSTRTLLKSPIYSDG